ncbi:hypothetical protein CR513_51894, partial [Mucuna pruriens]
MARNNNRNSENNSNNSNVNSSNLDPSQNSTSPYYVHLGENLATALISPLSNGRNYNFWVRSMRLDSSFEAWGHCSNLVLSWILNSVSLLIAQCIAYAKIAAEAWQELK